MTKARDLSQTPNASLGFKNRIINGAMMIDQRNAGASVTVNTVTAFYATDRFRLSGTASAGVFTGQQSTVAPTGFVNSLLITTTTNATPASGDSYYIVQNIEGFNTADLMWGTANAATVTLSFWVRSSLTGTFGGSLSNSAVNRSYPFTYTISAANTWEQKSITIAGDTTGTWVTNNGVGIRVYLGIGVGSSLSGTAGAWAGSQFISATGATSVVGTNGATFYITGVQLEKGSTATSFDYRPYGTELALCQRYYQQFDSSDNAASGAGFSGVCGSTSVAVLTGTYLVEMRAAPTITYNNLTINYGGATSVVTSIASYTSKRTLGADITVTGTPLTVGRGAVLQFNGGAAYTNRIALSSEL